MSVALQADLRRKVAVTLAAMEDEKRPSGTLYECEIRMGRCNEHGFCADIEPCLFYGSFEMVAFHDVYSPGRVGALCVRQIEHLPHSDPQCKYRVRHMPADARRCRSEIKRVVNGLPVRQFCSGSPDAHDVRISLARETRIREHECAGKRCEVPEHAVRHERRTIHFDEHPFWKVDFTRVRDASGGWRYHIEIELRVRSYRAYCREAEGEPEWTIGHLVDSGIAVLHRVQAGLKNARVRHQRLNGAGKIRDAHWR